MSIQEHLNKIRKAIKGSEVRESIAKGIETAYDDASEKDNANMEVKIARGTHPNLRSRLEEVDNKQQQTTAQLAHKTTKGQVNINHFDETTRQTFLEAQGIDVNYVLGDENVAPRNTTFFKTGKNLFDKTKASLDTGLSSTTGVTSTGGTYNDGRATTDFIRIEPETDYVKNEASYTLAFYDANKTYISGTSIAYTFTTPPNAVYLRTSFPMTRLDSFQLEKGTESTVYEPYIEKIPLRYQEVKKITTEDIEKQSITPDTTTFFTTGKNLFDKTKASLKTGLSSTTGVTSTGGTFNDERFTTDFIEVEENTEYTKTFADYTIAFYDANKDFISGMNTQADFIYTFTTPPNTKYLRASFKMIVIEEVQIEKGDRQTVYEPYTEKIKGDLIDGDTLPIKNVFTAEFTTTGIKNGINENNHQGLYLIATKQNNVKPMPVDEGYLYLDELEQKLYYSKNTFDNPEYLCDWDLELSDGLNCERFHATITNDGDIIFMRSPYGNAIRTNPIIYPSGEYDMPKVIDFGENIKPLWFAIDNGIEHHSKEDYFIFGEYRSWNIEHNDTELYLWKVSKPYDNPDNWRRVDTWIHRHYSSGEGANPTREIGHFHTANYDFYSGAWVASTGDIGHQCRFLLSKDGGETWVDQQTGGGQRDRTVGVIFTEDAMYWQTDSTFASHALYKVNRDSEGYPDFSNIIKVAQLSGTGEAGYATALMREPYGLLFLDRAEPRHDGELDFYFYSLEDETLYLLGTYYRMEGTEEYEGGGRFGFPVLAYTHYQSPYEDGIITGGTTRTKPMTLDLLGSHKDNLIGNLKIKVVRVR